MKKGAKGRGGNESLISLENIHDADKYLSYAEFNGPYPGRASRIPSIAFGASDLAFPDECFCMKIPPENSPEGTLFYSYPKTISIEVFDWPGLKRELEAKAITHVYIFTPVKEKQPGWDINVGILPGKDTHGMSRRFYTPANGILKLTGEDLTIYHKLYKDTRSLFDFSIREPLIIDSTPRRSGFLSKSAVLQASVSKNALQGRAYLKIGFAFGYTKE